MQPTESETYRKEKLTPQIVHIGFGAFHRAHQALYTDELARLGNSNWGICEINLLGGQELIKNLRAQEHQFHVIEKGSNVPVIKTVNSVCGSLHIALDGSEAVVEQIAAPTTRIVSITITEKGYGISLQTKRLDPTCDFIRIDLDNFNSPKSAIGCIVKGLQLRKQRNLSPISVLSCDNMPENGVITRNAVVDFAQTVDPELAIWIEQYVTFPSTMVDRIVPALTPESQQEIDTLLAFHEPCGIICEPFRQWVIEDNFAAGRPEWELVGAELVENVLPYEEMKLRMLNGSHSFLAYLGYLAGYEHIADCMEDEQFKQAAYRLMMSEQAVTLNMPDNVNLSAYAHSLIERYCNPNIKHRTWQIAMDGSQKLPQRLLESVQQHLKADRAYPFTALAIAAWIKYVGGVDEQGNVIDVRDPQATQLKADFDRHTYVDARVTHMLSNQSIFPCEIGTNVSFIKAITESSLLLDRVGAKKAVAFLVQQ
ncbi:mannitol dehydrogenase family protein [Vibrio sp. TRT 17S01]|uniref:mannitol dehydrogenase family protein n=1 Tax=Vibrio sp. TRT 17S01 TaxID=3418505 RepID=UPI003CF3E79F